ncbi:MAG: MaoC family dehydratase N-terminal domain-containing protein [Deltaproteobacteria bacterium]|uniref:MaoC family dehydratase N-terminal domain-containing protein n=1 Tax=Candidatus Zymogenus saltonus TaxID=2844893 RepID=A0A9D8PMZ4_9DELT|nr:MaoC family dehydratase N-terminal domain-containing protein [Candidatus Zymogenus saltonus]
MADKSKVGMEFPEFTFEVEKGKIAEFAMAISQKEGKDQVDQVYADKDAAKKEGYNDIIAPPTFQTCFVLWAGGGLMPMITALGINLGRLLHGEEEYEYFNPIHPGDVISCKSKVTDMYEKEKKNKPGKFMEFTVLETEMKNQKGELVIKGRSTLVER